jgi:putative Mg2+ transporter-C (MgtC) family protein
MAIVIGGFIGYEREMSNRPAGFITHTLVCVGATVVALIQIKMVEDTILIIEAKPLLASALKADIGRVVAQVVTGVGFLGAGTIIFDKGRIKGLTTATTIWVVACIGLAIGLGYYEISIISGFSIIFIMVVLRKLEQNARDRRFMMVIEIEYIKDLDFIEKTSQFFRKHKVQVRDIKLMNQEEAKYGKCQFVLYFSVFGNREETIEKLSSQDSVVSIARQKIK